MINRKFLNYDLRMIILRILKKVNGTGDRNSADIQKKRSFESRASVNKYMVSVANSEQNTQCVTRA